MRPFSLRFHVERPPAEVFAYLTDPERLPEWQKNAVEVHVDGPMRQGARIREVRLGKGDQRVESIVEVAAYEPDRVFDLRIVEGAARVHADHRLEPAPDGGTIVTFTAHGELQGLMKLSRPLLPGLFRKSFLNLKHNLEQ